MARTHAGFIALLCTALLFSAIATGFADGVFIPAAEAPTTIFSTKLGSADVDLSLIGAWTAGLSLGGGFIIAPGLPLQALDGFPGLDQGFLFSNTPDITISLDLLKRFFLDVTLIGSFDNNALQMGYRGSPGEVLQSVILGTQGIGISPSTLLQVPSQPKGSLGASAEFVSGASTNDLLLRWDPTQQKHMTFIGKNELTEQEVGIDAYVRGMYFFLPDVGLDPGTLQVFIEDPAGTYPSTADGRKYRLAAYDDVVLDSSLGLISLRNAVKGRVLVFYRKGAHPVGDPSIGSKGLPGASGLIRDVTTTTDFSFGMGAYLGPQMSARKVNISGIGDCLLLWEPGDNSPFEIDNSYAFSSTPPSDVSKISYRFNLKDATASTPTNVIFQSIPAEKRFLALQNQSIRATFANFYPFADPTGLIYGPQRDALGGKLEFDLLVQFLTPVTDYTLEADIEAGSVQVRVNGIAENRFEVDPSSGKLTLLMTILPTDRIEVTYRKAVQGTTGGDILFAWKDQVPLADWATLTLSAGIRWNANPWTFSQEPYSKSGTVMAAVGIDGKTDLLSYSAQAGVAYTNPDTTGVLRLFGMEGSSIGIDLSEELAYPASAALLPTGLLFQPTQVNRGELIYRNYRTYDALGSASLEPLEIATAPEQKPYANGSRMGPYNVVGDSKSKNTKNLVLEYALLGSDWVGAQIPLSAGNDVDLSGARAVSIRLRGVGQAGAAVGIYLQIGSISEDLDGLQYLKGQPKSEGSKADAGFDFVDQAHSNYVLKVGARYDANGILVGNGILDSEDRNANGILDLEDSSRIVTLPHLTVDPAIAPGTDWTPYTFPLSDTDRQALVAARSVRIIVMAAGAATGSIVIDSISVEGTPFWPATSPTAPADRSRVSVRQIREYLSATPPLPKEGLEDRFVPTYKLFHPNGETNEVLETAWGVGGPMTSDFQIRGFVPLGTGGIQYQTFISYFRTPTPGATYTFKLADASGVRIQWHYAPTTTGWHELKVSSLNGGQVLVDGTDIGKPDRFDSGYGSLAFLQVDVPAATYTSGFFYLDEVYCTDPAGDFGAAFVGTFSAKIPGTIIGIGNVALLSNLSLRQDLSLATTGFSSLYGIPLQTADISSRTHVETEIAATQTSIDLLVRDEGGSAAISGGHRVTFPSFSSPLSVTDTFSLADTGDFSRDDAVKLTVGSILSVSVDASANAATEEVPGYGLLTQGWQAGLSFNPFPLFNTSSQVFLSQSVSGYPYTPDWYGARWARETVLLLPWQSGVDKHRTEKLDFTAAIPGSPIGLSFAASADASGSTYTSTGFSQQTDLSMALSLLVKLGQADSSDSLNLGYKRSLGLVTAPTSGSRFQAETSELARILGLQSYFLQAPPVLEIFTDNEPVFRSPWASASQAAYTPSLNLTLQRSYGSRLIDLLLPSSIELDVGQTLSKTNDLTQTIAYIRPRTTTRAVNLFGTLGAFPLLTAVRTDDYSLSFSGSLEGAPGSVPVLVSMSIEGYATLTGERDNELTLVETLRRDQASSVVFTNDAQALLDWKLLPPNGVPLPFFPADATASGRFENRESADISISYQAPGAFHPLTVLLGHATSLVYPGHGSVKASLNLGMDIENPNLTGQGLVWRFAVRAALEAKLTF
jgi:hypothetical protein